MPRLPQPLRRHQPKPEPVAPPTPTIPAGTVGWGEIPRDQEKPTDAELARTRAVAAAQVRAESERRRAVLDDLPNAHYDRWLRGESS